MSDQPPRREWFDWDPNSGHTFSDFLADRRAEGWWYFGNPDRDPSTHGARYLFTWDENTRA